MSDLVKSLRFIENVSGQHKEYESAVAREAADRIEALEAEVERMQEGGMKLAAAISRIDYLLGEPNEMEVSDYDLHCDEDVVVERVKAHIPDPDDLRLLAYALEAMTMGDRLPAGWSDALDRVRATLPDES